MPTLKEYNVKLSRFKNLRQITGTMKMVSASKLRRAQEAQRNQKAYARHYDGMFRRLSASPPMQDCPLASPAPEGGPALVVVFTSDRGLCGGFNNNLCKRVLEWISEASPSRGSCALRVCGYRGYRYFRGRAAVQKHYDGVTARPVFADAQRIGDEIQQAFLAGEYGEVHLAYNVFRTALSQTPAIERRLPVDLAGLGAGAETAPGDSIFEPEGRILASLLLSRWVNLRVYSALLNNAAGEHAARMTAMDNASRNADDLIENTKLLRNRARQASITSELIEIVAGAEALK